ncbi:cobalamin 5'-phosphate synthase [Ammonifex degensii KC4]|uniref:Adenosylcobinamide-GDP ribazoletransferase n=1 Tax=Ammonifex degensii (strain DSM 10501 / KC4) TaxID=429009 RepID=C9R8D4_AMMDK|nr:adenosylcobinamide-GDP ribazoletransferase [Ammonifex degensii]ACX52563.1 cobalamin 5'-phosphate synthase [Ammonifex degensii KC4]
MWRFFLWPWLLALQNLTRLPLGRIPYQAEVFGRATVFFPLVGLVIGGLWTAAYYLLSPWWPPAVVAAALCGLNFWVTGGMHADGFIDYVDGLGGRTPAERLAIMRDSTVGAFGVMGGIVLGLFRFALFFSLPSYPWQILLLVPVIGRTGMVWAIRFFPYARPQGQGKLYKEFTGNAQVLGASLIAGVIAVLIGGYKGVMLLGGAVLGALLLGLLFRRQLGGLTGDTYGALNEILEIGSLATGLLLW